MKYFAFISRHTPTSDQIALAAHRGIALVHVGDADAFALSPSFVYEMGNRHDRDFDGVIVVHPAAAMRLCKEFAVGVFENANRAPEGEKPQFETKALYVFDMRQ